MRPKSVLLLVLALGCGLVASIGITQVMAKRDSTAETSGAETQPILVALDRIPARAPLTAQVLKLEEWPKGKVPEGAVSKLEDADGRRTRTAIYPGEPILESKLFDKGASDLGVGVLIPKGYRVVSVKVDSVSGLNGMVLPGDRVDVAVSLRADRSRGVPEPVTKTFLQDVKVFAVNDQAQMDPSTDEKSITAKTVSLLVTPKQAQDVMLASEAGNIRLVMRSPDEKAQGDVAESKLSDLLGGKGERSDRDKESADEKPEPQQKPTLASKFEEFLKNARGEAKPAAGTQLAALPPRQTWPMRFILGSEVKEVVLEQQPQPSSGSSRAPLWKSAEGASPAPRAAAGPAADADVNVPEPGEDPAPGDGEEELHGDAASGGAS